MKVDRAAAIQYARQYWNRPCDDGIFWTSNAPVSIPQKRIELNAPEAEGWEPIFAPDSRHAEAAIFLKNKTNETKLIQPWAGLADCAHFLSRCLQKEGIKIDQVSVPKLVHSLLKRSDAKMLAEKVNRDSGQRVINTGVFKPGDMIGYFNVDPAGDYDGSRQYSHSAMYVGKTGGSGEGRITCHTVCRFGGLTSAYNGYEDRWFLHPGFLYTLIHFSGDDKFFPGANRPLPGWWKIQSGATTAYYYIFKNGQAYYTIKPPMSKTIQLRTGIEGAAHYFNDFDKITFIWRKQLKDNGVAWIDIWTPGRDDNEFVIKINDKIGIAARL